MIGENVGCVQEAGGTCPLWSTAGPRSSAFPSRTENTMIWKIDALLQLLHLVSLCCAKARAITGNKRPGIKELVIFSPWCLINQRTRDWDLWLCSILKPSQSSGLFGWGREDEMLISDTSEVVLLKGTDLPAGPDCSCIRCFGNAHPLLASCWGAGLLCPKSAAQICCWQRQGSWVRPDLGAQV